MIIKERGNKNPAILRRRWHFDFPGVVVEDQEHVEALRGISTNFSSIPNSVDHMYANSKNGTMLSVQFRKDRFWWPADPDDVELEQENNLVFQRSLIGR